MPLATIIEQTRKRSAAHAWKRAQVASTLRHACAGNSGAASALSLIKSAAIRTAAKIAPELVSAVPEPRQNEELLSISFRGLGRLHLPVRIV